MISTPSYLSCTHSFLSLTHLATQLCYTQNYSLAPTLLFPFTAEPPYPLGRPCSAHAACRSLLLSHPTVMAMLPHLGACSPVCLSIPYNTHLEGQGHGCWKVAHPYSPHSLCRSAPLLTLAPAHTHVPRSSTAAAGGYAASQFVVATIVWQSSLSTCLVKKLHPGKRKSAGAQRQLRENAEEESENQVEYGWVAAWQGVPERQH